MNSKSHIEAAWSWLDRELDRWSDGGLVAQFWWRDDDASENSAELERLLQMSQDWQVPLALAVIPARLDPDLSRVIRECERISILQHGYSHDNHANQGQRKIEFGGSRSNDELLQELAEGHALLQQHFDDRMLPVLVPPWNRIEKRVVDRLPALGFRGISTLKARRAREAAPGLLQVNVHLDPINWSHASGFVGVYPAIAILLQHLVARRCGYRDAAEPTGILSHHLVQNDATWLFLDSLLEFLGRHPAVRFVDARDIWD